MDAKSAILIARTQHNTFKLKLQDAITKGKMDGALPDYTSCDFGKWYYGEGQKQLASNADFRALEEPHKQVHDFAKHMIDSLSRGDKESAKEFFEKIDGFHDQWEEIINRLIKSV